MLRESSNADRSRWAPFGVLPEPTWQATLGSSSDVRAQIQSHGLGCIQARHHDRRNYMVDFRAWPRTCRAEVLLSSDSRVGTGRNLGASLH